MKIYPEPGTYVPVEDQHLLNNAFEEFEPGEYVGYQLHDPSLQQEEGTAIYIYAIVIEEVSNTDAGVLLKLYKIDIGHDKEPVVVSAARLHRFHRLEDILFQPMCMSKEEQPGQINVVMLKKSSVTLKNHSNPGKEEET